MEITKMIAKTLQANTSYNDKSGPRWSDIIVSQYGI